MLRFLAKLFRFEYEPLEIQILREQLAIANEEKKQLHETLINLVKPEVVHQSQPTIITPAKHMMTFSRRRAELERANKKDTNIRATSPFIAEAARGSKPVTNGELKDNSKKVAGIQSVADLERELAVGED